MRLCVKPVQRSTAAVAEMLRWPRVEARIQRDCQRRLPAQRRELAAATTRESGLRLTRPSGVEIFAVETSRSQRESSRKRRPSGQQIKTAAQSMRLARIAA